MHKPAVQLLAAAFACWVLPAWSMGDALLDEEIDSAVGPRSPYALVLPAPERYQLRGLPGAQGSADREHAAIESMPSRTYSARPFSSEVAAASSAAGIDPALVHAVIDVESSYNPLALSPKGAIGLMQVMPDTGKRYGVMNLYRPDANLLAGTRYLSYLLRTFDGQLTLALAAYNAGEGAVLKHGRRVPPYPETTLYVPRVLARYRALTIPAPVPTR
jgi:soluble lytic murein transglycosylase-like protein